MEDRDKLRKLVVKSPRVRDSCEGCGSVITGPLKQLIDTKWVCSVLQPLKSKHPVDSRKMTRGLYLFTRCEVRVLVDSSISL